MTLFFAPRNPWTMLATAAALLVSLPSTALAAATTPRFVTNGDEVTDNTTSLVWQRCSVGQKWGQNTCTGRARYLTWVDAIKLAQTRASNSGKAWRVPNVKELTSLVSEGRTNPAIAAQTFPKTESEAYWTNTPYANNLNSVWIVYFSDGRADFEVRSHSLPLRLVRDAP